MFQTHFKSFFPDDDKSSSSNFGWLQVVGNYKWIRPAMSIVEEGGVQSKFEDMSKYLQNVISILNMKHTWIAKQEYFTWKLSSKCKLKIMRKIVGQKIGKSMFLELPSWLEVVSQAGGRNHIIKHWWGFSWKWYFKDFDWVHICGAS